jgi:hypothetical protein
MRASLRWTTFVVALLLASRLAYNQEHQHGAARGEKVGTVAFATSCKPAARPVLNRAVALLHSFEFGRSIDAFNAVLAVDKSCAMAEWGIALSQWGNPFAPGIKSNAQVQAGLEAIRRARALGAATDRERGFIDAAAKLYEDAGRVPQPARVNAYRDAMGTLAARYPDDDEAAIFHALAIAIAADPADKSYAEQLKAGEILESRFAKRHDHPGLAHYIIHAYDVPPLADRALEAARQYATIAPSAPHALHMPSHTFTRAGFWQESIDTNIKSAASARRDGAVGEELHASDYEVYAYLQTGQDRAARRIVDALPEMVRRYNPNVITGAAPPAAAYFAIAAIPARYALERGAWSNAVSLDPRATNFPYTEAMTHFARALGAGRVGQPEVVRASVEALLRIRDRLTAAGEAYWAEQVDIQRRGATAWLAFAEGRKTDALAEMRTAADREDATEKSAVTPGPLAPAREMLGEMLLETGSPAAALEEFEATVRREPNRFRAVAGAARAAAAAGNRRAAASHYARLLAICARADRPGRTELMEGRRVTARGSAPRDY